MQPSRVYSTILLGFILSLPLEAMENPYLERYAVNRKVGEFSEKEDYSSPEAAYATMERLRSQGDLGFMRKVSVRRLATRFQERLYQRQASGPLETQRLRIHILEVHRLAQRAAMVLAQAPFDQNLPYIYCLLEHENGRWLRAGHAQVQNKDAARERFGTYCSELLGLPTVPKIHDPGQRDAGKEERGKTPCQPLRGWATFVETYRFFFWRRR